ncbi:hypothetical protein Tco_0431713 [Tanacetum coccineum]
MKNANPFVPIPPNGLSARISQELDELCAILAIIDLRLENIDHTHIIIPPPVPPFEKLLNDFMNPPDVFEMDDLESDNELVDTPLVSPFIDSDEESNDGEVLDELNEYRNAGNFYRNRRINSDGCDLAFSCIIEPGDGVTSYTRRRHNSSSDGVTSFHDGVSPHRLKRRSRRFFL